MTIWTPTYESLLTWHRVEVVTLGVAVGVIVLFVVGVVVSFKLEHGGK